MPTIVHGFDWPDRLVVGAIGQPGDRSFYLQARAGAQVVSVALEKEQSAVLADKIEEILDDLAEAPGNPFHVPSATPVELVDNDPLDQPVAAQFRTGALTLGWDPTTAQIVIEAFPMQEVEIELDPSDDGAFDADGLLEVDLSEIEAVEPAEVLLVRIPVGTARAFAKRTLEIVGAGRPICPFCALPMDPGGHVCEGPGAL